MNNLLKLFLEINRKAFIEVKKLEYAITGLYYNNKLNSITKNFNTNRPDVDKDNIPVLQYEDYPTITDLTRYIRNNFNEKYPSYIEIRDMKGNKNENVVLKLISVGDELNMPYVYSINNGRGKVYNYREYIMRPISIKEI